MIITLYKYNVMNKSGLVTILAIGTITGILIASLSYTNTTYASTF